MTTMGNDMVSQGGKKTVRRILLILLSVFVVLAVSFGIYVGQFYHAGEAAEAYIHNSSDIPFKMNAEEVDISEESGTWIFDGPGSETAIIFYPGAKVQTEAYAPIMYLIAQAGYDCFLVDMPFHLAFFGINKAEDVIEGHPQYKHWYMSGHSLGGAMAGNFSAAHLVQIDGVIFLAAYPTRSLNSAGFRVLSIYGSLDGVLNREHYQKYLSLMPQDFEERVIEGGNHGQFGDYGQQKGDQKAAIDSETQWKETAEAVDNFIKRAGEQ